MNNSNHGNRSNHGKNGNRSDLGNKQIALTIGDRIMCNPWGDVLETLDALVDCPPEVQVRFFDQAVEAGIGDCQLAIVTIANLLTLYGKVSHSNPGHEFLHSSQIGCVAFKVLVARVMETIGTYPLSPSTAISEARAALSEAEKRLTKLLAKAMREHEEAEAEAASEDQPEDKPESPLN